MSGDSYIHMGITLALRPGWVTEQMRCLGRDLYPDAAVGAA